MPFLPPPLWVFSLSGFHSGPSLPPHALAWPTSSFLLPLVSASLCSCPLLSLSVTLWALTLTSLSQPVCLSLPLCLRRPSGMLLQSIPIEAHRAPVLPVLLPSLARFGPGSAHSGRESVLERLLTLMFSAALGLPATPGGLVTPWTCWWPSLDPRAAGGRMSATWMEGGPCRLQGLLGQDGLDWGT